jgi:hypothetical protein
MFEDVSMFRQLDQAVSLAYVVRRFGEVTDLAWAQELVDAAIAAGESGEADVYLRFLTADATPPPPLEQPLIGPSGDPDTDALITAALWCDQVALPADYLSQLQAVASAGPYRLTHAYGSLQLMVENGCGDRAQIDQISAELAPQVAELLQIEPVADIQLQACSILTWTGRTDLVPADYLEVLRAAQLEDGGWADKPGNSESDPDTTVWGLRCMLELEYGTELEPTQWVARD